MEEVKEAKNVDKSAKSQKQQHIVLVEQYLLVMKLDTMGWTKSYVSYLPAI